MNGLVYVGVDVAKDSLEVALQSDAKSFSVTNDRDGIGKVMPRLPQPGACVVVLEATGGYERTLIAELLQAGHRVETIDRDSVLSGKAVIGLITDSSSIE